MASEQAALEDLKARMTEGQRRDMAELVANEVKRRAGQSAARGTVKPASKSAVRSSSMSGGLDNQAVGEMYEGMGDQIRALRMKKLQEKENKLRGLVTKSTSRPSNLGGRLAFFQGGMRKNAVLMCAVAGLAIVKIAVDSGVVDASTRGNESATAIAAPIAPVKPLSATNANLADESQTTASTDAPVQPKMAPLAAGGIPGNWSAAERQVLTELDARRVELEKRKQALDQRELELKTQAQVVTERIAELRTLSTKIITVRKERDSQYEARLEQLANVYGSMAPNEAAPLVAKLENDTAIALLRRMPGKRMGQILSLMEQERAVSLTKILSDKENLDDLPAK